MSIFTNCKLDRTGDKVQVFQIFLKPNPPIRNHSKALLIDKQSQPAIQHQHTPSQPSTTSTSPTHPFSYCDSPNTQLHTLDCGHIIFDPSPSHSRTPCAPNCTRTIYKLKPQLPLAWFKNTLPEPFICPQCVEECVRADYNVLLERSVQKGGARETNVRLWTYGAMMDMIRDGGRRCEGTSGLFATQHSGVCEAVVEGSLPRQDVSQSETADAWCVRETTQVKITTAGQPEVNATGCESTNIVQLTEFRPSYWAPWG
ncbi:hypothetical protein DE146DRAFT_407583 [Phaeosphaeria sp. MPI-PUGE-AT-0046c]|nr:hypothetical protein DE146DRAFT_407583 [Phaeosphaeria sp. MPI-PUGE-AT-0046c]